MAIATFRTDDQNSNSYARYPVKVIQQITTFTNSDTNTIKSIATGTTSVLGSRISRMIVTSNDTEDNLIRFYLNNNSVNSTLPIGFIQIPSNSGDGSNVNKNIISVLRSQVFDPIVDLDNNGNPYFMLATGWSLTANLLMTASATKTIQIATWLDDY
jgi:hypothetical protein